MRFNLPGNLALFVASSVSAFYLIAVEIAIWQQWAFISHLHVLIFTAALFLICFFLTRWSVHRFIYNKVKLIYKNIFNQKLQKNTTQEIASNPNILDDVYDQVDNWMKSNQEEMKKLKDQEAYRREFLGNLAHELKTPVFSTQGFLLTLLDGGLEDEKINRDFLQRAANGMERITNILGDLDVITRLESGLEEINLDKTNLIELVNEVLDSLEMKASKRNITLSFRQKYEKPVFVVCDGGKIAQVLTNLIMNSINYGKESGRTELRMYDMDNKILLEVADNGPGIEKEYLPRLFERFYRVDKSRSRNSGGSGLGLAIVKHIMEAHAQTINVRSTVDIGTTFSFTLEKAR
ncbi:MAG: sensor histidine kinase [Flavobacteriales bacterium]